MFGFVVAVVLALVIGVVAFIPIAMAEFGILMLVIPRKPPAEVMLLYMLGLYGVWLAIIWAANRYGHTGLLNVGVIFFAVLPLPSIFIAYEWQKSIDQNHWSSVGFPVEVIDSHPKRVPFSIG
jgi:hypothetical protein